MLKFSIPFSYIFFITIFLHNPLAAKNNNWQQYVHYKMDISFDVKKHQFRGKQKLILVNNSPDTLTQLFYHLYLNAFQPGSAMDTRSCNIADPDSRIGTRISKLKKSEIGFQKIEKLNINGKELKYFVNETILEVILETPILPSDTTIIEMDFFSQVPIQIRRNGRDSNEGIDYSMAQWYPKLCAYDEDGWHPEPYISREFYGNWGDFDVNITLDKNYVVAATGIPDNFEGFPISDSKNKIWKFTANNVHDFMWAADRDYVHIEVDLKNGPVVHLYYQNDPDYAESWKKLPLYFDKMFEIANSRFGVYPYPVFYVIQGGDGGMEYPMGTLITGKRSVSSLVGVVCHELMHSWYQGVLGINESLYSWMDEGFTTYSSDIIAQQLLNPKSILDPHIGSYKGYNQLVNSGAEEPLSTHADHYQTNTAYSIASYSKGCIFLHQLSYIIGQQAFDKGMLEFFRDWSFKHPEAKNFTRTMEKASGMVLDWYFNYWVNTTHTIDIGIKDVTKKRSKYKVVLERIGYMPMPVDLFVTYDDNSIECFNIPMDLMRGNKPNEINSQTYKVIKDWQWPEKNYEFRFSTNKTPVKFEIDITHRLADINVLNNVFEMKPK